MNMFTLHCECLALYCVPSGNWPLAKELSDFRVLMHVEECHTRGVVVVGPLAPVVVV